MIAVRQGRPVGVIGFARFRRLGEDVDTLWLNSLFVAEEHRGHTLGSLLLDAATDAAASFAGELFVTTDIPEWYEQRGWTRVEPSGDHLVLRRTV